MSDEVAGLGFVRILAWSDMLTAQIWIDASVGEAVVCGSVTLICGLDGEERVDWT